MIQFTHDDISSVVQEHIVPKLAEYKIFAFRGPLGAGKTTLIKEILRQCGVSGVMTSPTFTYVKTYEVDGTSFYHFDLYRLDTLDSFLAMGFDEYLHGGYCFIEWPEILKDFLAEQKVCYITLSYASDGSSQDELNSRELKFD